MIPDDLSNLTRMIGVASRDALIQRAGGIVALCRWDPWRVECTQILQRQFHKKIFVYLTTNENKNKLAQAMSEMCLNALKVDIYRARTSKLVERFLFCSKWRWNNIGAVPSLLFLFSCSCAHQSLWRVVACACARSGATL